MSVRACHFRSDPRSPCAEPRTLRRARDHAWETSVSDPVPALRSRRWCDGPRRRDVGPAPWAATKTCRRARSIIHALLGPLVRPQVRSQAREPSLGQNRFPPRPSFCRGVRWPYQRVTPRSRGGDGRCEGDFGPNPCCLWRRIGPSTRSGAGCHRPSVPTRRTSRSRTVPRGFPKPSPSGAVARVGPRSRPSAALHAARSTPAGVGLLIGGRAMGADTRLPFDGFSCSKLRP
ncbi:hypothetical protein QO001_004273 [Methylobacterium brachiatum]|uniref:Uncharacterized protein n=1 Tax=Methylobacterium brachiatum TaxID=269660 RepID=A0AAJ1TQZ9_9HYPH|nr:hypothetical protein [Methylobacterium brachiatum]